ncbi:MAG: AraC family transcriptional regulator [Gemmatimonadota bacterium]
MSEFRRVVLALVLGRIAQARLRSALTASDEIRFFETVADVREALADSAHALMVLMEAKDVSGDPTAPLFRFLTDHAPAIVTIGFLPHASPSAGIRDLVNSGVNALIQEGVDDFGMALRAAYDGGIEACAARAVRRALDPIVAGEPRVLVDYCLQYPREDLSIAGLARALGCDRKTLWNTTARMGLPAPSDLVIWSRLFLAAAILESTGYTVEKVALQLSFASPSAFRNACRRHAKQKPAEWRRPGGLAQCISAFVDHRTSK